MRLIFCIAIATSLAGCAITAPPANIDAAPAPQWYAPLPHHGSTTALAEWWRNMGDPLLSRLIESGQRVSPSVAAAATRIAQARATYVAAGAALEPKLDAVVSLSRSSAQPSMPLATTLQGGLQSAWEIDLFGANRQGRARAGAQLDGARAGWHEARVAVAADTANQYYRLRSCLDSVEVSSADAASRAATAHLTQLSRDAGFTAPASAALADASAAESTSRVLQQRALCDVNVTSLVALTDISEPELRRKLAQSPAVEVPADTFMINSVPAQVLRQRPDIYAAERAVAAASAGIGSAEAQRYPRLSLSGSVGAGSFRSSGVSTNATTWTIGPLALTLPILDGGVRSANVTVARAVYDEAAATYRAKVRQAVQEVEAALLDLASTRARSDAARRAVEGYQAAFKGTESRYHSGLASLVELEDARRLRLAAELAQVDLQQQRRTAFIALYRAAGGGWQPESLSKDPSP